MAKTQNDQQKSPAKDQENRILKNESLKPQIQPDQLGLNTQMANAVNFPEHATPDSILQLQQRYGNNEVRRIIQRDPADDFVTDNQNNLSKNIADEIQHARSGGQPLPPDMMNHMGSTFGKDLSNVRLHPDQKADEISRKIQAKAFTIGNDIFFRNGAYSPNSAEGLDTLTHELTHVVQQSSGYSSNGPLKLGNPNDKFEQEAEGFAKGGYSNSSSKLSSSSGAVQRLSLAGVKKSVGGIFSRGSKPGSSPTSTPAPTTPPPVPTTPAGLLADEWVLIKKAGVTDKNEWSNIDQNKQDLIKRLVQSDNSMVKKLVSSFKTNTWPTDDSGAEILDSSILNTINTTFKLGFLEWSGLKAQYKKLLFDFKEKPYIQVLVELAKKDNWPKDGSDNDINDENIFNTITQILNTSLLHWQSIRDKSRRGFLLSNSGKSYCIELARFARSGIWPMNGGDQDLMTADSWEKIKAAYPNMTPSYWNGFDKFTRTNALLKSDSAGIKEVINKANFSRNSTEGAMDKIGKVTGHGVTDAVIGSVGLAGSITSLSKGTGDNATLDRAGASTSAVADAGNLLASGGSLLGGIAQYRRGKKMDTENSSRASQEVGKKQKSKGKWGITQSLFGIAGSGSSFAGNVTKASDPTSNSADKASSGLGVAGGFFGMFGSALGLGKGSASMNSARKRSSAAKKYVKEAPTGGTLTDEENKMNAIAQFTAKNQNKTGKGFGIFKSVTSFVGSTLGSIGSIGSLAGMSKEGGFGLGIAGAAMSGLGILGGVGQVLAEETGKPKDADLETQTGNIIELLRLGKPKGLEAAKFVKNVLKINLIDPSDDTTWTTWIDEDLEAAKALIKSKLSKF